MDTLLQAYKIRLDLTPVNYVRSFHETINWKNRLIGILGQKGVGKSTMILQHIKLYDKIFVGRKMCAGAKHISRMP